MYLVTLTRFESRGIYADPYVVFKWNTDREEEAFMFMERVVNLLDMEPQDATSPTWYKMINSDDISDGDELVLDFETLDQIDEVDDLEELLAEFI